MQAEVTISSEAKHHLWTREEYYKLAEQGFFKNKRVELIEGEIIDIAGMGHPHRTATVVAGDTLRETFGEGYFITSQCPLDLSEISAPEPDIAVIEGNPRDYTNLPLTTAVLVVEISETTVSYDRTDKASLYAKYGVADYWLLNLKTKRLEVRRRPIEDENASFGFSYSETTILKENDFVSPIERPDIQIAVRDLLPF
jgi:Uma2 family endonuclease